MTEPTVCIKGIRAPFFAAALVTGLPIPELTARFDVPATLLSDLDARVPHSLVVRVWDELAAFTKDDFFGLTAAKVVGAPQLDMADLVLQQSPNLRALITSFERYQRIFHDANDLVIVDQGDRTVLQQRFSSNLQRSRHFTEFILAMWVARLRLLVGPSRMDTTVTFRHARLRGEGPYEAVFGARVEFDAAHDALWVPRARMDEPLLTVSSDVMQAREALLDKELEKLNPTSFPLQLRTLMMGLLRAGASDRCTIELVGRKMGVSRRTLQRRLADTDTTFRDVLDAARREVALAELSRGTASMTDLAFLLGFSEHSAFCRAFRRWTGTSPATYVRGSGDAGQVGP